MKYAPLINDIVERTEIKKQKVIELLELAVVSVLKKKEKFFKYHLEARYEVGDDKIFISKVYDVVEEVKNPEHQVSVKDYPTCTPNEDQIHVESPLSEDEFSLNRKEVNVFKQIFNQSIRNAEKNKLKESVQDKMNTVIEGSVSRVDEQGNVFVTFGTNSGILYKKDQIPTDNFSPKEKLKALITGVNSHGGGAEIKLSRKSHLFVYELIKESTPEIQDGVIEVTRMARFPGHRTKMVLKSNDSYIDPVSTTIGNNGWRIQNIINELGGERINLIKELDDEKEFLESLVKPGEFESVLKHNNELDLVVSSELIGKTIGSRLNNLALVSSILGKTVNIISAETLRDKIQELRESLLTLETINDLDVQRLISANLLTFNDIADESLESIKETLECTEEKASSLLEEVSTKKSEQDNPLAEIVEKTCHPKSFKLPKRETDKELAEKRLRESLNLFR